MFFFTFSCDLIVFCIHAEVGHTKKGRSAPSLCFFLSPSCPLSHSASQNQPQPQYKNKNNKNKRTGIGYGWKE
jgi:hypothetical protein